MSAPIRCIAFALALLAPIAAPAQSPDPARTGAAVEAALDTYILPGMAAFETAADTLADTADKACTPEDPALRAAWGAAFDAWLHVSQLNFGPALTENRAFALGFWPDTRGMTPRTLTRMIDARDPVALMGPAAYAEVSIAARGFHALEALLFDPAYRAPDTAEYRCALVQAMAADIALTARAMATEWRSSHAALMRGAGSNATYASPGAAARVLLTALSSGLDFTAQTRLGRPMGSFERPRPERAESRLSGRSLRNVTQTLAGAQALALALADPFPETAAAIAPSYDAAQAKAAALDDPVFAGVSDPTGRIRVEVVQQAVARARADTNQFLGPRLGVAAGFNAMDGD